VFDRVASADLVQDGVVLACSIWGNQDLDRFADDLLAGVSEQPFGGRIPARDGALEIPAENCIFRALDDRRHELSSLEQLPLHALIATDHGRRRRPRRPRPRIGETVSETGNTLPSFRTRIVSRCSAGSPVLIFGHD